MTNATEDGETPLSMRVAFSANDVVAAGRVENVLQVPSPIYTAEFTDSHHVLIGAGGGGRKFGMANIALLLRVQSLRSESPLSLHNKQPTHSSSPSPPAKTAGGASTAAAATAAASPEAPVWRFAAALDLGVDIPWCTSTFLPFPLPPAAPSASSGSATDPAALSWTAGQRSVLEELVGFLALSSITSFCLIGVYGGAEPTSHNAAPSSAAVTASGEEDQRYLRLLARISVPNDEKDPDKKPIALTQNVLTVAHDDKGVLAYALTDLVGDSFEDEDAEAYAAKYAAQAKPGAALQRRVPHVQTAATPIAEWQLPARVNDLAVNRVCLVQAEGGGDAAAAPSSSPLGASAPCKAHLHEHLILAAVLHNKTVVLSSLRLRRKYTTKARHSSNGNMVSMCTALTLAGPDLPLPFKLLTSSLRLVRLFGWGNIDAAQQAEMRRRLTWLSLQEKGRPTHGALCSLAIVAFNTHTSESFIIHGAIDVTPTHSEAAAPVSASSSGTGGELSLKLHWSQPQPSPVLADAITSLSVCADVVPDDYAERLQRSPVGAAVPHHFIVGTVEGWVASVRWEAEERRWRSEHVRPSPFKSVAQRFPALHKEPVSCVAVSAENDVVTADIAQNVALTTLPYVVRTSAALPSSSASSLAGGGSGGAKADGGALPVVPQQRLATSSALFPTTMAESGLLGWVMGELERRSVPPRMVIFLAVPLLLLLVALIIMRR